MFKVKFVVHDVSKGESFPMRVVGSLPALGLWIPLDGLEMEEYYDGEWESLRQIEIPNGTLVFYAQGRNSSLSWLSYWVAVLSNGNNFPAILTENSNLNSIQS